MAEIELTPASHDLFMEFARDAGNWSSTPPTDGNVQMTKEQRGNLTQLKRAGLVDTFRHDGSSWVSFTTAGVEYAIRHGVTGIEATA